MKMKDIVNVYFYKPDIEVAKKHAADSMYSYFSTRRWGYLVITAAIIANVPSDSNIAKVMQSSKNNSHPLKINIVILSLNIFIGKFQIVIRLKLINLVIAILE